MASGGSGGGLPITGSKAIVALSLPVVGHIADVPAPLFVASVGVVVVVVGVGLVRFGWRRSKPITTTR